MKKTYIIAVLLAIIAVGSVAAFMWRNDEKTTSDDGTKSLTAIRLGWQTPWATQGQLTQILQHTEIPKQNGLALTYKGFDSGAPLNEAALGGQVDVLFTADQPAISLLSKDSDWVIIGRLMYNRVSLYVPPESSIASVADLKGKTVAVPFGTAAQKALLINEKNAGLDPKTDVNNINLGIYEQSDLVKDKNASQWGTIDAMAGFDPTPAIFEEKGLIKTLKSDKIVSVILMSKGYIKDHPQAPQQFMSAFKQDYQYYRGHSTQANKWFTEAAKLNIPNEALETAAKIEPNISSQDTIRLGFNNDDYKQMQATSDFLFAQQLITKQITVKDHVDLSHIQ